MAELIQTAEKMNCRVAVINGRLSERSAKRYQKFAWITRNVFKRLSWLDARTKPAETDLLRAVVTSLNLQ